MANREKTDPPDLPQSKAFDVGRDGKIDGIYRGRDSRRDWTQAESAQLELVAQKPKPVREEPLRPRRQPVSPHKVALAAGVIISALLLPFAARWAYRSWRDAHRVTTSSGLLVIDSVPGNARVFIDGVEVGRTPYVAPNTFKVGTEVPARITYPGAQDWVGTFPGGVPATFTAELQAQPADH